MRNIIHLFNESKIYSNKYLSQRFNIPVSTIEKRVRRLDRANLIKRKVENELNTNKKWITTARTIELDPDIDGSNKHKWFLKLLQR
mgnify:CR=1 FL=1